MCTIRRARIKKLIKLQRKGKSNAELIIIDLDAIPVINEINLHEYFDLWCQKGVLLSPFRPCVQRIGSLRPRKI